MNNLIPADALAASFGVGVDKLMEWRRTYQWEHVKIGRKVFFTPEQVAAITARHTIAAGKVAPSDGRTARSAARRSA